jgi:peptidoglycan/LPS O-acetylase OafA/YrhL
MRIGDELDLPRFVVIPFAMLMSIAVAAIINRTIEKPALRSIRGWYDRGRRKQPELVVVEPASQTSA